MILAFHPTQPAIQGREGPVPLDWTGFLAPWSTTVYKQTDFGALLIQELIHTDFGIYIWTLNIKNKVCLYPTAKAPTIALQFMIRGELTWDLAGNEKKILQGGNYEMFYIPIGFSEAWFEPGFYESLHIELQPAWLEELIAIRPEIRELIYRLLNSSVKGMPIGMVHGNYKTRAILQNLRDCDKRGASLHLEMHKFILELLSEYFSSIQRRQEEATGEHIRHRKTMLEIKNHILTAPNIQIHSLENVSRKFGISKSVLKRSFKALFQITVARFVHQQVMNKAIYLLTTTDQAIDDIAGELGYEWQNSFEQAFKKYYRYSPADLRNDPNS